MNWSYREYFKKMKIGKTQTPFIHLAASKISALDESFVLAMLEKKSKYRLRIGHNLNSSKWFQMEPAKT